MARRSQPGAGKLRRVCFFNHTPFWGGGEKWHLRAARAFRDRGYQVVVAGSPGSVLVSRARDQGLEAAEFAVGNRSWLNPLSLRRLRRFFRERGIEAVVFNGPADVKAGGLAARAAGVPRRAYRRGLALPVRNHLLNRYLFTRVLTHVIPNSEETRRALFQEMGELLPPERVQVITNGIELAEFERPRREPPFRRRRGEVVLATAGRLTAQKNHAFLLDMARVLVERGVAFRLAIAGSGELEDELRARSSRLGLDGHVTFLGFVDDVPGFLREVDVFLLSSLWEGFGNVLLEAGAARLPTVTFDLTSNPEIIVDGTTGFLVEPENVAAFADRVAELVADAGLRARMGAAARKRVEEHFLFQDRMDELEAFLFE